MQRRLAAILAADVVGYSRLMGEDEAGILERLKLLRSELVQPQIKEHDGRIVKLMGDGLLAEFPSVVEAVQCAVEIQQANAGREAGLPQDRRIRLRIGVNLGDIIVEGSDIYGDGVNVAARLEGLAEPGGVCISGTAFDTIEGKVPVRFEDLGPQTVKNIAKPVHAYRLIVTGAAGAVPDTKGQAPAERPSIAVLPFANLSGDHEQEYFSDGITEDLITELSRFKELAVLSRNSSFVFKGRNEDLKSVGRKLNAQYILEGSVRRANQRIRVTSQLIDALNDVHIWAERYDRDLEDIFEVQDDLVRRITSTLVGRLEAGRLSAIKRQSSDQLKAYDLFLRAREHFFNWSIDDNKKARDYLQDAIAIEPNDAAALALLSEVVLRAWLNGWSEVPDADLQQALELAGKADEIDDGDSRTQTALGMANLFNGDPDRAKYHFEAALSVNPNDMRAIVYYSRHAVFEGDIEKAVELCRQAQTLNPYGKYSWNLGLAYFVARDYAQAISLLDNIRNPPATVLALLAASHAMANDSTRAASAYQRFTEAMQDAPVMGNLKEPEHWRDYYSQRWPFRNPDDFEHLAGALRKAGLPI